MSSNHPRFGLTLLHLPGTSIITTLLPTYYYSLLNTYNFKLLFCSFVDISPPYAVPPIISFLIVLSLVTPFIKLNISISAISNSLCFIHCTCIGTVHHRRSYHCLAYFPIDPTVYYSMKHNPEYHLPVCHHDCILCGIPALVSPLSAYVAPKYLNVVTLSIFSPC